MTRLLNGAATKRVDVFAPANFEGTRRPFPEASVLPAICYTSPEWYQREVETMFMRDPPARSTVQVVALNQGFKIEIECVAGT